MKIYKIIYLSLKVNLLIQISKSGKYDGVRIEFCIDGKKFWQDNLKNGLYHGLDKDWWRNNSKNKYHRNWKKGKTQGIQIVFK